MLNIYTMYRYAFYMKPDMISIITHFSGLYILSIIDLFTLIQNINDNCKILSTFSNLC